MDIGHVDRLLSQFTVFRAVRNEARNRNRLLPVVAGVQAKLPVKGAGKGIHIGKARAVGRVNDLDRAGLQLLGRLGEPVFADVLRGRQAQTVPEQPVGVPRGKQRRLSQIGQGDLFRVVPFNVVLHLLDGQYLLLHVPQLLTGIFYRFGRSFSRRFLLFCAVYRRPAACMTASTAATGSLPHVISVVSHPALSSRSRA